MGEKKVISGLFWSFAERFGAQLISFVVSIVLARLLLPEDYGAVALVTVFISIANVFVTNGFGNALIQKENADNIDFSTIFFFNIFFSLFLYCIIYVAAPFLASYYDMPELKAVFRVMGIRIILSGVNSVQRAFVSRNMLFKKFFVSTSFGTILSAVVGILMAYYGFGVWALVAQYLTNTTTDTIVLWFTVKWRPALSFSWKRLRGLLSYGWKLLASSLLTTVYTDLNSLVIGKVYGSSDLAYYNKGQKFPQLFVTQINSSIESVLFPAMSRHQNDIAQIKKDVRNSVRFGSFCIFPLIMGLAAVADDLVVLLLTDKWSDCIIYLKISCISYLFLPVGLANIQAIKAIGRSDVYLKLDILKKIIGITLLALSLREGVLAIAIAEVVSNILGFFINVLPSKKYFNYSFTEIIKDILPSLILSIAMYFVVVICSRIPIFTLGRLIVQVTVGCCVYLGLAYVFKVPMLGMSLDVVKKFLKEKNHG